MRKGLILAGSALFALLPAARVSAQSFEGPFAGYDRQVAPRFVFGAEAGVDLAAPRAGYRLDPATLAYVRGGYANARLGTGANAALSQLSESEYRDSWTLGAGIERKILKRISARLEYRYSDLGEGDGAFDRHRLLAGIAYRF